MLGWAIVWQEGLRQVVGLSRGASQLGVAGGGGATQGVCNRNPGYGSNGNDIIKAEIAQSSAASFLCGCQMEVLK